VCTMKLSVSKEAAEWYKNEMDLQDGDYVQFFVKLYGGIPTVNPNYSLGVSLGKEGTIAIEDTVSGITFYFNDNDSWFLDEYSMKVIVSKGEVDFIFDKR